MSAALAVLMAASVPFPLTPFASLGQEVASVDSPAGVFTKTAENDLFTAGSLKTQGGTFLVFLRTDGTLNRSIRAIEFSSDGDRAPVFGVEAHGSCDWLKKKLGLAYGAPVNKEEDRGSDSVFRKITWQSAKDSVVVSYYELVMTVGTGKGSCGFTAEVIR